jgi:hypothetical protein
MSAVDSASAQDAVAASSAPADAVPATAKRIDNTNPRLIIAFSPAADPAQSF